MASDGMKQIDFIADGRGRGEERGGEEMKWWPEARGQRDSAEAMDGLMNTIRLVWFPAQRADTSHGSAAGTIHLRLLPSQLPRSLHGRKHDAILITIVLISLYFI